MLALLRSSSVVRVILRWIAASAATALGFFMFLDGAVKIRRELSGFPWDFNVDYRLARAYLDGFSPYTAEGAHRASLDHIPSELGHPPSTAFWALPFARFEENSANAALGLLCLSLLLIQILTITRELRSPIPIPMAWLAYSFVMSCEFFTRHIGVGQISAVIGFFFFIVWMAVRKDDDWLAGLALGSACSLKPFAAVVVVLFLVLRRYRVVGTAVGVYTLIAGIMTVGFGWSSWPLFLAKQKEVADLWLDNIHNQSLHGIVQHLFRPTCTPHGPVIAAAAFVSSVLSVALIGAACWLAYRLPRTRDNAEILVAAFIPLAIFTSQWAWEHYDVILIVPFAVSVNRLFGLWTEGSRRRWVLLGAAGLAGVVCTVRIPIYPKQAIQHAVRGGDPRQHVLLHVLEALNSAPTVLLLMIAFGIVIERIRRTPRADGASVSLTPPVAG